MTGVTLPPRRLDFRIGEPFDNVAVALKAAFDVTLHAVDPVNDHSILQLRAVARVS